MSANERQPVVRLTRAPLHRHDEFPALRLPAFVDEVDYGGIPLKLSPRLSYRTSSSSRTLVLILVPMLILQPFVRVQAEEVTDTPLAPSGSSVESSPVADINPTEARTEVPAASDDTSGQIVITEEAPTNGTADLIPEEEPTTTEENTAPNDDTSVLGEEPTTVAEGIGDENASSTESTDGIAPVGEGATTSDDLLQPPVTEEEESAPAEEADSSEAEAGAEDVTVPLGPSEVAPEGGISLDAILAERERNMRAELRAEVEREFTKGCIALDGIGYYCLKPEELRSLESLAPSRAVSSVSVETDPSGGDREIFAEYAGERFQLTSNTEDDAFPAKDLSGKSVVWQGQRDGRWQIFFASFASDTPRIVQITNGSENNFNPRVEGDTVVWQTWIDGNWEIVLARAHRGEPRRIENLPPINIALGIGPDWDVTRVTMNPAHDMFPSISSGIVTWQRSESGGWSVFAYSPETNVETRVSSAGAKSENARFTVVYEEEDEKGRVRLIGYDVATGERIDLSEEAKRLPDRSRPYVPVVPVAGTDQAALPTGTTTARALEEENGEPGPLPTDV